MNDSDYMTLALNLAKRAKGQTSPNPMVGVVIVKNNRVIATGFHRRCGGDHAEIVALKKAGLQARGARLYVTLEPCSHYGRTPPCVDKIIESGIKEVVVGMIDPNPVNNGRSIKILQRNGIKVRTGFLKKELHQLNEPFIKFIKHKMPFVVVKWAQTLDGKIAVRTGHSKWITSAAARDFSHRLRSKFDAILVGIETVLKDDPGLNARKSFRPIKKVIVDSRLRVPLSAKLFKGVRPQDIILATTTKASKQKIMTLRNKGVDVIVCPVAGGRVDLKWLLKKLAAKEISSIFIEGGSAVIGSLFKAKLVDKILCFIAPKIIGDQEALSAVRGLSVVHINRAMRLNDVSLRKIGDDILIEAYVHRNR